ncbi:MAG: ATP-binding protein [Actinomycetota bacterium]|nr:ATP-binding protein [Actinomycetota bacterium]
MRPLDPLSSIKFKLGVVIVAAVGVSVLVNSLGLRAELPLALVGLAAGALALIMVQLLARGMTSPLREMAIASRAMARGDYSRRVTATSRDEVGELARAFNVMAAELAETDRMRRDLVANVSHELRTPITALQASLENMVDGVEPPDAATIRTMLAQVERLGRLVDQLLDLSRLEAGVAPLERRRFRIEEVLARVVEETHMHLGAGRSVQVDVAVDPPGLEVQGDPERIHQVVANLLDNAVRHSPVDGGVVLRARGRAKQVSIEVEDQGPGIPPGETERVFERFYRADRARSSTDGGSGLGLSIARWIVDLHGGAIRVEPNTPRGTRMVVSLPGGDR